MAGAEDPDRAYEHVRNLVASIHSTKNVRGPGSSPDGTRLRLSVQEDPSASSISSASGGSERSLSSCPPVPCTGGTSESGVADELVDRLRPVRARGKSASVCVETLTTSGVAPGRRRRRASFLPLSLGGGGGDAWSCGPLSAGTRLPTLTVTAPAGESPRHSFAQALAHGFGGFALRRHSNTSLHRSESMVSLACFRTLSAFIQDDNLAGLQSYLAANKNASIDDKDENGTTSLMVACERGRASHAHALLEAGADAAAQDGDEWAGLALAARGGHLAICRDLLDHGAPIDQRDVGGWTALMWASYKGHEDVVDLLLERGADVNANGNYHISSLVWASGRRHAGVVRRLLAGGARANSCDKYGTSALVWAARAGDAASCAALLGAGAAVDTAGMYSWTALLQATMGNHFEIVQMLLEHKPNVNVLDKDGCTALTLACKEGFYDIAVALLNAGAYINIQDRGGDTCLIHAVKGGHKSVVEALLKKYADVDVLGKERKTAVYSAVEKGHAAILKLLLHSNPDLELATKDGDTALLRAVRSRSAEMVQMLLDKKARVHAADKRGDTVLHIAMRARSKQIVEILLRNPKHSQLLYRPNRAQETPYNMDMNYPKTILGQIFGARKLNTNEDNENMLGYELYSSALADMLSEPSLTVPITVGLYARWGSGKSFLLNKLREEMKNFARQWVEGGWRWTWAVAWGAWHAALLGGATAVAARAPLSWAAGIAMSLLLVIYLVLLGLWYSSQRYEWYWPYTLMSALSRKFNSLKLVLQVVFCHPPGPQCSHTLPAQPIRFHFTDQAKSSTQEGEASVIQMIVSLADALESQYGKLCTRLYRAFRPKAVRSTADWRWRRVCCVPHILAFEFCFICALLGVCVLILFLTNTDDDQDTAKIQQGLLIGVGALVGVAGVANLYTWSRVLTALLLSPRAHLNRTLRRQPEAFLQALRPEVLLLTDMVMCLDAFTGQQTRLVVVVDALDSCEQERVLLVLNAIHSLCSEQHSPFVVILAIDPHIISKAVEVSSRRAFSESNIGGWDYLRNMVQLPFYLQNSALRRVKVAQQTAQRRMHQTNNDDFSSSLQRSVSARRLSNASEIMSSQERIKGGAAAGAVSASSRTRRLRPSESVASSVASGLHRMGTGPPTGAADLSRVLLTDDYFSDVNPRSMRRLMNVLYITGRLLKAFQIDFNWYNLASWVNLTEQWPFRTSWIIFHHETYEEHIDETTSLKHIYEKIKPNIPVMREAEPLMELDRDERKLEVFLNFHRSSLLAADLKIFLPFTINLDPYIKKVIKEEHQQQQGMEEDYIMMNGPQKPYNSKFYQRKNRGPLSVPTLAPHGIGAPLPVVVGAPAPSNAAVWPVWDTALYPALPPAPLAPAPKLNFHGMSSVGGVRLSRLSVDEVCEVVARVLPDTSAASDAIRRHKLCGIVLTNCDLSDLKQAMGLPFGDWELFKMLIMGLKEQELALPLQPPVVTVVADKCAEPEKEAKSRPPESQRSRPSNMEKQVTLEEQMICGALQTLNEEALEDVLQGEPPPEEDNEICVVLMAPAAGAPWPGASPSGSRAPSPPPALREPSILKPSASFKGNIKKHVSINNANYHVPPKSADPVSSVSFKFENETEFNDQQITMKIDRNNSFKSEMESRKNKNTSKTKLLPNVNTAKQSAMYEQHSKHNNLIWQGSSNKAESDKEPTQNSSIKENILSPSKAKLKPPIPKNHCEQKTAVTRRSKSIVHPRPSSLLVTKDDQSLLNDKHLLAGRSRSVEDSTKGDDSPANKNKKKISDKLNSSNSIEKLSKLKDKLLFKSNNAKDKNLTLGVENLESEDESTPLVSSDVSSPSISYEISNFKEKNDVLNIVSPGSTSSCSPAHQSIDNSPPRKILQKNFGLECEQYIFPDITLSTEVSPLSDTSDLQSPYSEGTDNNNKLDLLPYDKTADAKNAAMALQQSADYRSSHSLRKADSETSLCNMLEPYNMELLTPALSDASMRSGLWRQDALDDQEEWNNSLSTL